MSPINLVESGLQFGPFDEDKCFLVEQSKLYAGLGQGVKMVEFLLLRTGKGGVVNLLCVEAKTTAPQAGTQPRFDEYFFEIRDKMLNALLLFVSAHLGRHGEAGGELPDGLRKLDLETVGFRFVLVVSTAQEAWLQPLQDKFTAVMRAAVQTFKLEPTAAVVLDEIRARRYGLIS